MDGCCGEAHTRRQQDDGGAENTQKGGTHMALTGMQIYKNLPKSNCKECGLPTCMAFAMQVAAKQKELTACPHLSGDAEQALSEASAPPMKLIKIGPEDKQFEFGQETVMFRHEEKFHRRSGIAVRIAASLSDEEVAARVEHLNNSEFMRVGDTLKVELVAVEVDGVDDPAGRAKLVAEKSQIPLILIGSSKEAMSTAAEAIKAEKPLIYKADADNIDDFSQIAASNKLPLAVSGADLEELANLTTKARTNKVEEVVLAFKADNVGETIRDLTIARRSALKKQFRALGYPSMVEVVAESPETECVFAASFAAKYAAIVIIDGFESWELLPIMTAIQDVYTDPQVPNTVEAKLYEIGSTDENSPVMFTTNFSLTYFSVEGEVERSKVPTYISVVETEGLGVLNAYAGDKISAEKVVKTLQEQKVADKVKHRKLIIPGLLPIFRAEIEDTSEWEEVIIGPENAREIPGFLTKLAGK
ncbi:acetyl-CoA decarbonylase/synthase complex subunit gamma [candidate division KSB3 bacterium]|uniref:Acetyl-CoA decarbonylase/synthase complex subunit gamma n=1 Tax=candidate division KSB3 bacterium TaxID=2044937 RepID=A0A9D5Q786_9BACT|nr:acetyl-CoA decarbonylase/synthase complex subunit gamma [candidate division KSB3 bacterium]MBD3326610.1 acetyl-CoA decarbonylase/synthase complex subunit gamma [candidate division KSB3 bacterium]